MSPTGFRWFLAAVIAVLVAIMLVAVRANAARPALMADIAAAAAPLGQGIAATASPLSFRRGERLGEG
jgi:hypothetical protein